MRSCRADLMGHERVGTLPRSVRWLAIVSRLGASDLSDEDVRRVAGYTIDAVRSRFRKIETDPGIRAAFAFIVAVAASGQSSASAERLAQSLGIDLPRDRSAFSVVVAARRFVDSRAESLEYSAIAKAALGDAVADWHNNQRAQPSLFDVPGPIDSLWARASTGAGFCELSRLFFARFTERYLNYFLERAASERIKDVAERDRFAQRLRNHLDEVSRHAFETARITQSFAAGWFNRHIAAGDVGDPEVQSFLSVAFGKLRDELLRESGPQ
jgi:hypothetical protein